MFPTGGIAFKRFSFFYRFTNRYNISMTTFTIMSHFSITRYFRAWLTRVAICLASMLTSLSWFFASLWTSFFHKFFNTSKTLTFGMTDFLTNMTTFHWKSTCLSTVWCNLGAIRVFKCLFTTSTSFFYWLQTGWTIS